MTDLAQAIAGLRIDGPTDAPWTASQVADGHPYPSKLAEHVATILNAALSGELIPKADAKLAVAEAYRKAAGGCLAMSVRVAGLEDDYYGDPREYAAGLLEAQHEDILALADTDALAELQALRAKLAATQAKLARVVEAIGITAEDATSIEIPGGFIPQETPDWHRGYDAAIHKARAALEGAKP